jgi:hypothetical protein
MSLYVKYGLLHLKKCQSERTLSFRILLHRYILCPFSYYSSSFPLGVLQLMLPEAPQPYGLLYYPRILSSNFAHSSALPRPLSWESWSCKPIILDFSTFATGRLREILAARGGTIWI